MSQRPVYLLFLVFFLPFTARAYSREDLRLRRASLLEMNNAFAKAESDLPPCEGLEHVSKTVLGHEPPSSCPKARAVFAPLVRADAKFRANCQEMSRWLINILRDTNFCVPAGSKDRMLAAKTKLQHLHQATIDEIEKAGEEMDKALGPERKAMFKSKEGKGEFVRMDCASPVTIMLQFRKRELALVNKHYGLADYVLESVCEPESQSKKDYERVLKHGF